MIQGRVTGFSGRIHGVIEEDGDVSAQDTRLLFEVYRVGANETETVLDQAKFVRRSMGNLIMLAPETKPIAYFRIGDLFRCVCQTVDPQMGIKGTAALSADLTVSR